MSIGLSIQYVYVYICLWIQNVYDVCVYAHILCLYIYMLCCYMHRYGYVVLIRSPRKCLCFWDANWGQVAPSCEAISDRGSGGK